MKTHELKLDVKYFEAVKYGKKNFEIRKNDRDFEVGDILDLKAWEKNSFVFWRTTPSENHEDYWQTCLKKKADTIKVRIVCIISSLEVNEGIDFMNFNPKVSLFEDEALPFLKAGWRNDWDYDYFLNVLKEYFHTDKFPDGYVVLGIEEISE